MILVMSFVIMIFMVTFFMFVVRGSYMVVLFIVHHFLCFPGSESRTEGKTEDDGSCEKFQMALLWIECFPCRNSGRNPLTNSLSVLD